MEVLGNVRQGEREVKRVCIEIPIGWFSARDPSLRLKSGTVRDDAEGVVNLQILMGMTIYRYL